MGGTLALLLYYSYCCVFLKNETESWNTKKKNTRLGNLKCFDVYEIVCTLALFVLVIFLKNPSEYLKTSEEKCVLACNLPNILQNYFDIYLKSWKIFGHYVTMINQ